MTTFSRKLRPASAALALALLAGLGLWARRERFEAELIELALSAESVRPGDELAVTLRFESRGARGSRRPLRGFIHVEQARRGCAGIAFQLDFDPLLSTQAWSAGRTIVEGPRVLRVPADAAEGEWLVHVGLYEADAAGRRRLDARARSLRVAREAQPRPCLRFEPAVVRVDPCRASVRPGEELVWSTCFENRGTLPADRALVVFGHLEPEGGPCSRPELQTQHLPEVSTRRWEAGARVLDGPTRLRIPRDARAGERVLHVGLFDRDHTGHVLCEDRSRRVSIDPLAPPADEWTPAPSSASERASGTTGEEGRWKDASVLDGPGWSFSVARDGSAWKLEDHRARRAWSSCLERGAAASALVEGPEGAEDRELVPIPAFARVRREGEALLLEADVRPFPGLAPVVVSIRAERAGDALRLSWSVGDDGARIVALRLLEHALRATDAEEATFVLPIALGELRAVADGLPRDVVHEDRHLPLSMCGLLAKGSALLVSWTARRCTLTAHYELWDSPRVPGRRAGSLSLALPAGEGALELRPLGPAAWSEVPRAYRAVLEERGLLTSRSERIRAAPVLGRLEGGPVLRATCLSRFAPRTRHNPAAEERVVLTHTFDELARIAEHWRHGLGIERAHLVVAGWGREGYDRGLPDVFPAAEECGGDAGLRALCARVRELGYVVTLHENYHDIYADSPSYSPELLRVDAHGRPYHGAEWTGGLALRICPTVQLGFAERNLARIAERYGPEGIFLDTSLTLPLEPCFHPDHPLAALEDLVARRRLFALVRSRFELLGLEGLAEWALPDAHWFEGLLSHRLAHLPRRTVVPLLPLALGGGLRLASTQADRLDLDDARALLDFALHAQMPYVEVGRGVYFERPSESVPVRVKLAGARVRGSRRLALALDWQVLGAVPADLAAFVHLVERESTADEGIEAQADHAFERPSARWRAGETIRSPCPEILLPVREEALFELMVGLHSGGRRLALEGQAGTDRRARIARVHVRGPSIEIEPQEEQGGWCFARADGGWAEGLHPVDRLLSNVVELLGPLQRLSAEVGMTDHAFLRADRSVERTRFGELTVTANFGSEEWGDGRALLPRHGLLIESPTFVAFHATRWNGVDYPGGALFTLQSRDGEPLERSRRVRIHHGFGPARLAFRGALLDVPRELEWSAD